MLKKLSTPNGVFSAHAEVVPVGCGFNADTDRILRARGGSSQQNEAVKTELEVFSAHAEVVPQACVGEGDNLSILRARGGSSLSQLILSLVQRYSPRTRR